MAEQQADRAVPTLTAPAKKQRNTLLVLACAVIFWMYTIFLIVHPLLIGLQYSFWVILGYLAYRNFILEDLEYPVCPYQDKVVARWKRTYFYRLLYVNATQKEGLLPFCRFFSYMCFAGSYMMIVIILLVPFLSKRDTYYENGYIEKIEPVNDLRGCGNAIIYIKKISNLNTHDELIFEISYSKASHALICGNYSYVYSLQKDGTFIFENNTDLHEKMVSVAATLSFLCFCMSMLSLIPFFSTYDKRNSTS